MIVDFNTYKDMFNTPTAIEEWDSDTHKWYQKSYATTSNINDYNNYISLLSRKIRDTMNVPPESFKISSKNVNVIKSFKSNKKRKKETKKIEPKYLSASDVEKLIQEYIKKNIKVDFLKLNDNDGFDYQGLTKYCIALFDKDKLINKSNFVIYK